MEHFKITDQMRKWCNANREGFEAGDMETVRRYAIDFCEEFDLEGNFDTRGDFYDGDISLMYVADVHGLTVIIDGDVWCDTVEEFLSEIERMENEVIRLNNVLVRNDR